MNQRLVRIFLLGAAVAATVSATPAISKKENKAPCVDCHTKKGSKDLNKVGTCYKDSKDLKACQTANPAASISNFLAKQDRGK
jgi:hypothetical protein